MSRVLYEVLLKNRTELINSVICRLNNSGALHYQRIDAEDLHRRAENLVGAFLASIDERPAVFTTYLELVANERIAEGVLLHEIQIALQILEEKAWRLVVDLMPQVEQVHCLSRITGTIGAAKDQLAHIYLQHLEQVESRVVLLQQQLDELAKGTDGPPLVEEDLMTNITRRRPAS